MNTPNLSAGLLGPGPGAPVQAGGGLASAWGEFGHVTLISHFMGQQSGCRENSPFLLPEKDTSTALVGG